MAGYHSTFFLLHCCPAAAAAALEFWQIEQLGLVVRRISKFGIRILTNLLLILKKIGTNPDYNPNPKNQKKICH
jgi:hypothetical protein